MCWLNRVFIIMVATLAMLSVLNACGNKGELKLTEPDKASKQTIGTDIPTASNDKEDEEKAVQDKTSTTTPKVINSNTSD